MRRDRFEAAVAALVRRDPDLHAAAWREDEAVFSVRWMPDVGGKGPGCVIVYDADAIDFPERRLARAEDGRRVAGALPAGDPLSQGVLRLLDAAGDRIANEAFRSLHVLVPRPSGHGRLAAARAAARVPKAGARKAGARKVGEDAP